MHKCQHGQKITQFCATDCCVWKEAAGCQTCIKKYHNHMGTTVFLSEEQVVGIVKKYTMDSSIKPKCRVLQQAIYSYFTLIKTQITTSIDAACKNIINQIGYPYLYANNTLSTYKRLKNKQYRKLGQKDFKLLYEVTQKINDKELVIQQARIYLHQMKIFEQLINSLEDNIKQYETLIKKYNASFVHDTQHIVKINQIFKNLINSQTPKPKAKQQQKKAISPVYHFKEKQEAKQKQKQKQKINKSEEPKPVQAQRMTNLGAPPSLARPNYSRDVSIDKKIVKQHRFAGITPKTQKEQKQQSQKELNYIPKVIQRQKSQRIDSIKRELNSREAEINQKKKKLIEMMNKREESAGKQKSQKNSGQRKGQVSYFNAHRAISFERTIQMDTFMSKTQPSQKNRTQPTTLYQPSQGKKEKADRLEPELAIKVTDPAETKSIYAKSQKGSDQNLEYQNDKLANNDIKNHAFTQLPVQQKAYKNQEIGEKVGNKLIVVPAMEFKDSLPEEEFSSPLLRKKSMIDKYNQSMKMSDSVVEDKKSQPHTKTQKDKDNQKILELIPIFHKKSETLLQLRENEQVSLALLLKSLALKAEQAVVYLQKAILHAQNNLSAAQYLSFLYLQLDRPSDCLKLCNKTLEKIENTNEPEDLSLILNNNKAAALNILGRYSQSIVLLQKCLRYREKDYFYKNLGDAYYSISIYEKATYNYERALRLNDQHDQAHYNLAVCLYGQQNYHNAKLSIEKAIQINPMNQGYHQLLSNIITRINNY